MKMSSYCSICISYFSTFFSLSPSLLLSIPSDSYLFCFLSSHSSSFHDCRSPPISRCRSTSHHCRRSTSHHTPPDQHHRRSLSPHSPFFSFDQDQTIVADQLVDQDQTTAARSLIKSSPVNSLISRCLINGFRVGWVFDLRLV